MISSVYWEWELLLLSIKIGIGFSFLYDLILILRMLIFHVSWMETLEDLVYWVYVTANLFQLQLTKSSGVLRGFSILGVILGMSLYYIILGKTIHKIAQKEILFLKRWLTEKWKLFKINLCKQDCDLKNHRRKNGTKRNSGKKEKTE
ncbi:MAG: spore cortex biosynthesis protein YabQ [Lachnospiraceae bacterium]|nr:spore cortex biosynthesis protein YabQ [Lachnospiraceae bacterium]